MELTLTPGNILELEFPDQDNESYGELVLTLSPFIIGPEGPVGPKGPPPLSTIDLLTHYKLSRGY